MIVLAVAAVFLFYVCLNNSFLIFFFLFVIPAFTVIPSVFVSVVIRCFFFSFCYSCFYCHSERSEESQPQKTIGKMTKNTEMAFITMLMAKPKKVNGQTAYGKADSHNDTRQKAPKYSVLFYCLLYSVSILLYFILNQLFTNASFLSL